MGIKFFYKWLSQNYAQHITSGKIIPCNIDVLLIDMNGIFHNSAQRVFKYGNCAPKSLMRKPEKVKYTRQTMIECFKDITESVNSLVKMIKPSKALVMCVDGVAPASKINQQRQRRFRACKDSVLDETTFNPVTITPGTEFMHNLSEYIDWYIKNQMTVDPNWAKLNVIFSSEKTPGEGEHKLIDYIRKHGSDTDVYCINAMDADLVMLSLATMKPKFYLLRNEPFRDGFSFVSIGDFRKSLIEEFGKSECKPEFVICDFILICFLCGNDFLPSVPTISILENSLDMVLNIYKSMNKNLTKENCILDLHAVKEFFTIVGEHEYEMLTLKFNNRNNYFPDPSFEKYTSEQDINLQQYKNDYYIKKCPDGDITTMCAEYIKGCEWVLKYYTSTITNWTWVYNYNYSPFASDIAKIIMSPSQFEQTTPLSQFEQLLCVIPPSQSYLLPPPLDKVLTSAPFEPYCPVQFNINYDGKKYEYEGIVELPTIPLDFVKTKFSNEKDRIHVSDSKRNKTMQSNLYLKSDFTYTLCSQYGNIKRCSIETVEN